MERKRNRYTEKRKKWMQQGRRERMKIGNVEEDRIRKGNKNRTIRKRRRKEREVEGQGQSERPQGGRREGKMERRKARRKTRRKEIMMTRE